MGHPRFSSEEIVRRGEQIYAERLREAVEMDENFGKIIVINIETGEYEINDDPLAASSRALAKHPGAAIYALRIGYDYVHQFGGSSLTLLDGSRK